MTRVRTVSQATELSQLSSSIVARGPTHDQPGDDVPDGAAGDVSLRLAAWLAAVSAEVFTATPVHDTHTPVPVGTAPTIPRSAR